MWFLELPAGAAREQDQIQSGDADTAVPRLYLRQHDRQAGAAGIVHQRVQRGAHQPDPRHAHRVLPGSLP